MRVCQPLCVRTTSADVVCISVEEEDNLARWLVRSKRARAFKWHRQATMHLVARNSMYQNVVGVHLEVLHFSPGRRLINISVCCHLYQFGQSEHISTKLL